MRTLLPLVLTLLLFTGIGYLLFSDSQPIPKTEITVPPLEMVEDTPPPLIIIEEDPVVLDMNKRIKQDATHFVDKLSSPRNIPVIISNSQGEFVRHDSDIILIRDKTNNAGDRNTNERDPTTLRIQNIIQDANLNADAMFYLHHVTEQDTQGLWGIIQQGLVEKFRAGLSLEGIGQNRDSLQVIIPADADERLTSGLSSFLGKLLSQKVQSSYIYNLDTQSIGRDSNLIQPGQQLVLIKFSPIELESVYQFFAEQREQVVQTYGIPD